MRRLSYVLTVAAAVLVLPSLALAGNQEVAEQIAANLRDSGQMQGYKIGVKYQEGTAWLRGQVADNEQMNAALRVAFETPGVQRVVNNLTVGATATETAAPKQKLSVSSLLGGTLRPMTGAVAAERRSGTPWADYDRTTASPVSATAGRLEASQSPLPEASYVATTFDASPALPTAALTQAEAAELPLMPMPEAVQGEPAAAAQAMPAPAYVTPVGYSTVPARYDQPNLPNYAWPAYAAHPNYAAVTYPKQYSPTAWPYIGPFYPYPQVPLGWRKVTLEWHDGWWFLDFDDGSRRGPFSGLFRPHK